MKGSKTVGHCSRVTLKEKEQVVHDTKYHEEMVLLLPYLDMPQFLTAFVLLTFICISYSAEMHHI